MALFEKVLIANRGEIAVRIARACRELGIAAIGVYSEADRGAFFLDYLDQAIEIGPAPPQQSYLNGERIVAAARAAGAAAIHPGYGFLSENADFAALCAASGLKFIGPPVEAIRTMGDKLNARAAMRAAGVPTVPGGELPLDDLEAARREAERLGYPVLLKAAAGGGGKGMRKIERAEALGGALRACASEALSAFGDGRVYMEKYLDRPRHVEIQVLCDEHGAAIHLGERDCSLQRRHQKVVEECPGPAVGAELRRRMGEVAVRGARAVGYSGAGTMEFLLDKSGQFYFLEMNTRLQVEHPVTELVTDRDLVIAQLRIAAGEPLRWTQEQIAWHGHAIEVRIYAEDPEHDFRPAPGTVAALRVPGGPGIREDRGFGAGSRIPNEYDPLLSKLVARGEHRAEAVARLRRALSEYRLYGVRSNLPFLRQLCEQPAFGSGDYDIGTLEELPRGAASPELRAVAAALAALRVHRESGAARFAGAQQSRWRAAGRARGLR
ncbi:MAG TPA: acetyl-CoA carboxylase biotin carboxylase subunit [Acidobacteriota bacterium]